MDIDGDGVTDNLLVAAPMFFSGGWERGKVYIYRITDQVNTHHLDIVYTCMPEEYCRDAAYFSYLHNLLCLGGKLRAIMVKISVLSIEFLY